MTLTHSGISDMGRRRTNNEDAFALQQLDANTLLAVVIDGVGGYEGGEVAAQIAQERIPAYLMQYPRGERLELLKQAVIDANNAIVEQRQKDPERSNMSCVLTSAIIDTARKVVEIVHVGDTRIYIYHNGELKKLSHDHSLVGYREEVGDLTEEQAMHHPQRNVISRDVGSALHDVNDPNFLEAASFPLPDEAMFLLCSDGLTDLVTSKQIKDILDRPLTIEEKNQALIHAANDAGGKDNVTVVLVDYQSGQPNRASHASIADTQENIAGTTPATADSPRDSGKNVQPVAERSPRRKHSPVPWLVAVICILAVLLGLTVYHFMQNTPTPKQTIPPSAADTLQTLDNADTAILGKTFIGSDSTTLMIQQSVTDTTGTTYRMDINKPDQTHELYGGVRHQTPQGDDEFYFIDTAGNVIQLTYKKEENCLRKNVKLTSSTSSTPILFHKD